jgi:hypothetical protein
MVSQNVDKLLQQVNRLDPQERQQLLEKLNGESLQVQTHSSEKEFVAHLATKGIIITVPPPPTPEEIARFRSWKPIKMPGGSLSDELIRDRR